MTAEFADFTDPEEKGPQLPIDEPCAITLKPKPVTGLFLEGAIIEDELMSLRQDCAEALPKAQLAVNLSRLLASSTGLGVNVSGALNSLARVLPSPNANVVKPTAPVLSDSLDDIPKITEYVNRLKGTISMAPSADVLDFALHAARAHGIVCEDGGEALQELYLAVKSEAGLCPASKEPVIQPAATSDSDPVTRYKEMLSDGTPRKERAAFFEKHRAVLLAALGNRRN